MRFSIATALFILSGLFPLALGGCNEVCYCCEPPGVEGGLGYQHLKGGSCQCIAADSKGHDLWTGGPKCGFPCIHKD
ncbi:unnamed protein product [Zymoseptoria tritici ST99CH_1A5]|uniref:Uncharacterized protein n=1 Tax=Zymoseptoria tritici ST99CH_1A5 TaxID=1276529 RepID=A0A1Y6LII5_ZYMTR|nr:unnamed protein product [Zymoseptoria tritici ST99CH_1A5]